MWSDNDRVRDDVIDQAARRLTEGTPSPQFRARVVERLDGRSRRSPLVGWLAPLATAAFVVVVAVLVARSVNLTRQARRTAKIAGPAILRLDAPSATIATTSTTPTTPTTPAGRPSDTKLEAPRVPAVRSAKRSTDAVIAVRTDSSGSTASEIDALAPPPLEPPSIALGELAPGASLELVPLDPIAPIAVTPLGEGDRP